LDKSGSPDKSSGEMGQVRYPPLEVDISSDKSGENLEKDFWMVKHIDLSPNFFDASLLIVRFSYDSNKI
jgi:hypothetical protein